MDFGSSPSNGDYDHWTSSDPGSPERPHVSTTAACQEISEVLSRIGAAKGEISFRGAAYELPSLPGLIVNGFGRISLPVCKEQVDKLVKCCSEGIGNVWTLTEQQVQMTSLEWGPGVQLLCEKSAVRLGFKDIELLPVLSRVVVYGVGGRFDQQEVIKDEVVAKLVVQLPSEYTGGDLVISGSGTQARYDLQF